MILTFSKSPVFDRRFILYLVLILAVPVRTDDAQLGYLASLAVSLDGLLDQLKTSYDELLYNYREGVNDMTLYAWLTAYVASTLESFATNVSNLKSHIMTIVYQIDRNFWKLFYTDEDIKKYYKDKAEETKKNNEELTKFCKELTAQEWSWYEVPLKTTQYRWYGCAARLKALSSDGHFRFFTNILQLFGANVGNVVRDRDPVPDRSELTQLLALPIKQALSKTC